MNNAEEYSAKATAYRTHAEYMRSRIPIESCAEAYAALIGEAEFFDELARKAEGDGEH